MSTGTEAALEPKHEEGQILENLEKLMKTLGGGVAIIDRSGRVVYYGKTHEQWFGPLEQNKGRPCYEVFCQLKTLRPGCPARGWFEGGEEPSESTESEIVTVEGKRRIVRLIMLPIGGPNGQVGHVLEVAEDITGRKETEHRLAQRNRQLTTINTVTSLLARSVKIDHVLHEVLAAILDGFEVEAGAIHLARDPGGMLRLAAHRGIPDHLPGSLVTVPPDDPLIASAREANHYQALSDLAAHGGVLMSNWHAVGVRSALIMPLVYGNRLLGILSLLAMKRPLPDISEVGGPLKLNLSSALENRRLFEQVTESEQRYRQFFDASPDSIKIVSPDFIILDANLAACRRFGYTREEMIGRSIFTLTPPEHHDRIVEARSRVLAGEEVRIEVEELHKDGSRLPVDVSAALFYYQGQAVAAVTARDISERKAAVRELRRTAKLTQTVTDAIIGIDKDLRISSWNPGAERIFGYSAAGIVGQPAVLLCEEEAASPAVFAQVIEQGQLQDECIGRRKNGLPINLLRSLSTITDEHGELEGYVGFIKDITEYKLMLEQLAQAQKIESVGKLAGGIAHDFNNILSGILGHVTFLRGAVPADSDAYPDVEAIEKSAKRAAGLTRQLLGFARGGRYQPQPIDINDVVNETVDIISRTMAKSILVQRALQPGLWSVEADRTQMQQVLMNLFINSRDAMPEGGTLLVETGNLTMGEEDSRRIYFSARPGKYVRVSVSDTGVGMDEETRQHVYEPFFSTKGGSGLGLSMVYGIVQTHRGFITLYSELGTGTTFRIYLPATEAPPFVEQVPAEEIVRGAGTILVVDDEEVIRQILSRMLEEMGYTVFVAANGQEALDLYSRMKDEIDLVLLDMIMPGMPGKTVFDRIRAINPQAKVLLSSGFAETEEAVQAQREGALGFLEKPYMMDELSKAVWKAVKLTAKS